MTTQLRTTPTTAVMPVTPPRKEAKDPEDQLADQFAAVLSALSSMAMLQPQAVRLANSQDETSAKSEATPEIGGADILSSQPASVIALQTLVAAPEIKTPNTIAEDALLPLAQTDLAQLPRLQIPIEMLLSQQKEPVSPLSAVSTQPAISSAPALVWSTSVNQSGGNLELDSLHAETTATGEIRTQPIASAKLGEETRVTVDINFAQQTLQIESARREANLFAGQLAITTRYIRENSSVTGAKTLLAGNGFDLEGGDRDHDLEFGAQVKLLPNLLGRSSFEATVRDFEGPAGANSVLSQTINQVIAMAESASTRQTRSLRLRLKPETLGQIDIELSRDAAGRISAHIAAERESARAALSQSLDQLRDALAQAGINVFKLQIRAGPGLFGGNRENADARPNAAASPSRIATAVGGSETTASGVPRADDQKFLSLRA